MEEVKLLRYMEEINQRSATFLANSYFADVTWLDVYFDQAKFFEETYFSGEFKRNIHFEYVLFEGKEKILFDLIDLSEVSFINTDITHIRFNEKVKWNEDENDKYKIVNERQPETKIKKNGIAKGISLGSIETIYRNLRENYEHRLRYNEAGEFFIREMELKRKYREDVSKYDVKQNSWPRRNLSLTGLYYHFSHYGESIARPTIIGGIALGLSTLFWLI